MKSMASTSNQPLLPRLEFSTRIRDLSSSAVEEFLEHKPIPVRWYCTLVARESRLLWLLSGDSIVDSVFTYMLTFATLTFSGHLTAVELAGASIAGVGIQGLAYGIMVCLSALQSRAGHPKVAKFAVIVVSSTSTLMSIFFSSVVLIFRVGLSKLFTSNSEVIDAVTNLTPLLAISVFLNGIQPILSGVAIGSGRQAIVAYVNLATYYLIGLPIGCVLGFKTSLGVTGIWMGMVAGVFLQTVTLSILTARINWNTEVVKASERIKESATVNEGSQDDVYRSI